MPPVFSQPGSVLLGGNPTQRPPGMLGAFPQFAQYPGAPTVFPLVGYQGSNGADVPRIETPEEATARIAQEERDRVRQTNESPSDPDMHEPATVETFGEFIGPLATVVGIGLNPMTAPVTLGSLVATGKTPSQHMMEALGLMGKSKGEFVDVGSFQSTLGANPTNMATPGFEVDPGLGSTLGLGLGAAPVGSIMDTAIADLGPDPLGSTPTASVVDSTPVGNFSVQNLDSLNTLGDKDNVASNYSPDDEEGAAAAAAAAAMEGSTQGSTPGDSYDSAADAAASDVSDAGANAADAGGMGGNTADNSGEGSVWRLGGTVPADADGNLEPVEGTVHEGEFVLTPEAVQMLGGPEKLDEINRMALSGGILESDAGMSTTRNGMDAPQQDLAPRLRGSVLLGNAESPPLDLYELAMQSAMLGGKPKPQRPMMMGG